MDILILSELRISPLGGHDVIDFINQKFGILLSPGTVYNMLYSLEREGLIEGLWDQRKRVYKLTDKGKENIKLISKANEEIQNFLRSISSLDKT
jgi:DNA-binding PadR family transcriptional regulator